MSKVSKKLSPAHHSGLDPEAGASLPTRFMGDGWWGRVLNLLPFYGAVALLVYMPFHIFLSQSLSLATGGLEAWKIGKDVLLASLLVFTICSVIGQRKTSRAFWGLLIFLAVYAGLHGLLWLANPDIYARSAALGLLYNVRIPELLVLGYGAALLTPHKFVFSSLLKTVLIVSTVVSCLGLLQYVLPKDILTHFGYSLERGARPAFYIDDHPELPRIMSTLREPNALGAYLLVPLAALTALVLRATTMRRRWLLGGAWMVTVGAILLTYSRSAWLGAVLVVALALCWRYNAVAKQIVRRWWPLLIALIVAFAALGWSQRNTSFVQEYIIHSNPEEEVDDLDSNDLHWLLVKQGVEGTLDEPLGHGPGTAGLVSIQNPNGGLLTENYYVQIAYEVGVFGFLLFIVLNIWVYVRLWRSRSLLGMVLCVAFWGYVLTNMLLHTWSNEAVATQWWLLVGIALGISVAKTTDKP